MITRRNMMLGSALILAGCANTETTPVSTEPNLYSVGSVTLQLAEGATVLGRAKDKEVRSAFISSVEQASTALAQDVPGGSTRARAVVAITDMRLRDATGRTFGGVNGIIGQMTVVDNSGNVLSGPVQVAFSGQAKNTGLNINGLPIGLLINAARNSSDQEAGEDIKSLVAGFSSDIAAKI